MCVLDYLIMYVYTCVTMCVLNQLILVIILILQYSFIVELFKQADIKIIMRSNSKSGIGKVSVGSQVCIIFDSI